MSNVVAHINTAHYGEESFDCALIDEDRQIFGVFDGMGTSSHAKFASRAAKEAVEKQMHTDNAWRFLESALMSAVRGVSEDPMAGTTATVAAVDSGGHLNYAHIGDSRLYVLHNGRVKQITSDEGVGNMLLNFVGARSRGVCQAGIVYEWDAFMLCSDGISGDWPDQFVTDAEVEDILLHNEPPEACNGLIAISKKPDDKTVIVVKKDVES